MSTLRTVHRFQMMQLRRIDPIAYHKASTMLGNGFIDDALQIIKAAMQAALTRLAPPVEYDLVIASRNYGRDPNDVQAKITWLKRAGQPVEKPSRRLSLLDLLPSLEGYRLVETTKTATEIVRKYRRVRDGE